MKPGKPLRRTALKSVKGLEPGPGPRAKEPRRPVRKRMRARSAKLAKLYREERVPLTRRMLEESPFCELGPKIKGVKPDYQGCWVLASCLHELKKRSQGGSIVDPANVMRACQPCNGLVEDWPEVAAAAGLVIRRDAGSAGSDLVVVAVLLVVFAIAAYVVLLAT